MELKERRKKKAGRKKESGKTKKVNPNSRKNKNKNLSLLELGVETLNFGRPCVKFYEKVKFHDTYQEKFKSSVTFVFIFLTMHENNNKKGK